jgi:hypothetical protein
MAATCEDWSISPLGARSDASFQHSANWRASGEGAEHHGTRLRPLWCRRNFECMRKATSPRMSASGDRSPCTM